MPSLKGEAKRQLPQPVGWQISPTCFTVLTGLSQQVLWAGLGHCVHSFRDAMGCPEANVSWVEELGLSVSGTTGFKGTRATQEIPGRSN